MPVRHFFLISLSVASVLFVRFNRQDLWIGSFTGKSGDHEHYYRLVEVFRNDALISAVPPPFNSRILVSYLASFLPVPADLALNIVISTLLLVGFFFAYLMLREMYVSARNSLIIVLLHIFSFPVFYYGAIGYLDAALVGWMAIGFFFVIKQNWIPVALIIFLGAFIKETIFLLTGASLVYLLLRSPQRKWTTMAMLISSHIAGRLLLNYFRTSDSPTDTAFFWYPGTEFLWMNLTRPRTFISYFLAGYPVLLVFFIGLQERYRTCDRVSERNAIYMASMAGITVTILISLYSFIAAYTDGRYLFLSYPFSIALSGIIATSNSTGKGGQIRTSGIQRLFLKVPKKAQVIIHKHA